ncbi:MAG: PHB depolymerase family esterase [Bacteriovoracaceae bacterium]|nr:PHB depolymerase family esterase [Bacteriovoracaceae bacterium]
MKMTQISFLLLLVFTFSAPAYAGTWVTSSYKGLLGTRTYKVYIPTQLPQNKKSPIVVMLHGCQQDATEFAKGTRIEKWADKEKFIALFPEQNIMNNPFKCWNWILPANNSRVGESHIIIEMLNAVIKAHNGDAKKVFAAGMSAGASMVNILGNCFPEKFKALASHDGTQYFSSYLGSDFAEVVLTGASVPSGVSAAYGNACSLFVSERPKSMPMIIFHGMKSPLMSPMHAFQIESQMKVFNDYLDNGMRDNSYFLEKDVQNIPDTETYGYNLYTTTNSDNDIFIERYMINNLSHGWSGGLATLPYNDPNGPDASQLIINFFKKYGL